VGRTAIVVGAGIGGLAAAAALAPHFTEVLVLERDRVVAGTAVRSGVPHGSHAHVLLLGGRHALAALLPGFESDLTAAGAVSMNFQADGLFDFPGVGEFPRRDFGMISCTASRPLIEAVLRRRVADLANVTVTPEARVEALLTSADGAAVTGVRHARPEGGSAERPADLVIDAAGRNGTLSLDMLARTGRPPPTSKVCLRSSPRPGLPRFGNSPFPEPPASARRILPNICSSLPPLFFLPCVMRRCIGCGRR
jgi:2-polyprenyl-6-methoxyphenol hydroxylase-like FAD-dependent oxidoreductase